MDDILRRMVEIAKSMWKTDGCGLIQHHPCREHVGQSTTGRRVNRLFLHQPCMFLASFQASTSSSRQKHSFELVEPDQQKSTTAWSALTVWSFSHVFTTTNHDCSHAVRSRVSSLL